MSDEQWQDYLKDTRQMCKYGAKCYQKNADHLNKFKHPPQQFKGKADKMRNNARVSPYSRNEEAKRAPPKLPTENETSSPQSSDTNTLSAQEAVVDVVEEKSNTSVDDNVSFPKITINDNTQYHDNGSDNKIYRECFLVDMPSDFFKFYECLKNEPGSVEKLLASVNLQLIGPYDLLLGKLPIIDDKDLYLIHWRFFYDPPEFQAVLKKKGKSEYHIGYFRDSPDEDPVFLAVNNSEKDYAIKPIAKNIFGAVYWYLQEEKKTSPFVSIACQKLMEKINSWAKEHDFTLEEYNIRNRQSQTVCKSFHGAGVAVPYNKKTQLGYRSLAESDAKIRKLFKKLAEAKSQSEKDSVLSEIQPVTTFASIAVDECDFGTGLEAGIAMFCSGLKELEPSALSSLCAVYPLLNRQAFSKIIQVHLKHRRKGPDMSIISQ
ncbi:histone PARylation factor 1 [Epargyreus clarus]|uniref:histone PARylation factor 1 n=1 Tax=Epargyreus clarus TaxID=520877 RepID=UPI003C2CEFBD